MAMKTIVWSKLSSNKNTIPFQIVSQSFLNLIYCFYYLSLFALLSAKCSFSCLYKIIFLIPYSIEFPHNSEIDYKIANMQNSP